MERYAQIHLKSEGEKLVLILPKTGAGETSQDWTDILTGLKYYLRNSGQNCPARTPVHLRASDRLMDTRQLQAIATILDSAELPLHTIQTQRRQTAVAAATMGYNVEQMRSNPTVFGDEQPLPSLLAEPLIREYPMTCTPENFDVSSRCEYVLFHSSFISLTDVARYIQDT